MPSANDTMENNIIQRKLRETTFYLNAYFYLTSTKQKYVTKPHIYTILKIPSHFNLNFLRDLDQKSVINEISLPIHGRITKIWDSNKKKIKKKSTAILNKSV